MPRLRNQDCLLRHRFLQEALIAFQPLFIELTPKQQWDIHIYFQTAILASQNVTVTALVRSHQTGRNWAKLRLKY